MGFTDFERQLLSPLMAAETQLVQMYRGACPFGNIDDGNRFADSDPAVVQAREAIEKALYIEKVRGDEGT